MFILKMTKLSQDHFQFVLYLTFRVDLAQSDCQGQQTEEDPSIGMAEVPIS